MAGVLESLFGSKPKDKYPRRYMANVERSKRMQSEMDEMHAEWKVFLKASNDFLSASTRLQNFMYIYAKRKGGGVIDGEEMDTLYTALGVLNSNHQKFIDSAVHPMCVAIAAMSGDAQNMSNHHRKTYKAAIKTRRELRKRVNELSKSNKPDLDRLNQSTQAWHVAATAYKEAETEFESWMEDFSMDEGYALLSRVCGYLFALETQYKASATSLDGNHALITVLTNQVNKKMEKHADFKRLRDAETRRLKQMAATDTGLMHRPVFDKLSQNWIPGPEPVRVNNESVLMKIERVVHMGSERLTPGILYLSNARLFFVPYQNKPKHATGQNASSAGAASSASSTSPSSAASAASAATTATATIATPTAGAGASSASPAVATSGGAGAASSGAAAAAASTVDDEEQMPHPDQAGFMFALTSISRLQNIGGERGLMAGWVKDLRTFVLAFRHSPVSVSKAYDCITPFVWSPDNVFAFYYRPASTMMTLSVPTASSGAVLSVAPNSAGGLTSHPGTDLALSSSLVVDWSLYSPVAEYKRMGLPNREWRLAENLNNEYQLCRSYPPILIVPGNMTEKQLVGAAHFRKSHRMPVLCWKEPTDFYAIFRSSQPRLGLKRARSPDDEELLNQFLSLTSPLHNQIKDEGYTTRTGPPGSSAGGFGTSGGGSGVVLTSEANANAEVELEADIDFSLANELKQTIATGTSAPSIAASQAAQFHHMITSTEKAKSPIMRSTQPMGGVMPPVVPTLIPASAATVAATAAAANAASAVLTNPTPNLATASIAPPAPSTPPVTNSAAAITIGAAAATQSRAKTAPRSIKDFATASALLTGNGIGADLSAPTPAPAAAAATSQPSSGKFATSAGTMTAPPAASGDAKTPPSRANTDVLSLLASQGLLSPAAVESKSAAAAAAEAASPRGATRTVGGTPVRPKVQKRVKAVLFVADCRPMANAYANVAKNGGWEVADHYPNCRLQFLGIENIHVVRNAFQELRDLFLLHTHRTVAPTANAQVTSTHLFQQLQAQQASKQNIRATAAARAAAILADGSPAVVAAAAAAGTAAAVNATIAAVAATGATSADSSANANASASLSSVSVGGSGEPTAPTAPLPSAPTTFSILPGTGCLTRDQLRTAATSAQAVLGALALEPHTKRILDTLIKGPSPPAKWLKHVSSLIAGALVVVHQLYVKRTSVLVHCSDGWDRTPQITALAQLLLDPYYRTLRGFAVLIEKEFMSFGHKFSQRCGHGDERMKYNDSQRSPIFIQFMDAVYQCFVQFPQAFEFNELLLTDLIDHVHSCRFGNFLGNNDAQRAENRVAERTTSVWSFILSPAIVPYYTSAFFQPLPVSFGGQTPVAPPPVWPSAKLEDMQLFLPYYVRWDATITAPLSTLVFRPHPASDPVTGALIDSKEFSFSAFSTVHQPAANAAKPGAASAAGARAGGVDSKTVKPVAVASGVKPPSATSLKVTSATAALDDEWAAIGRDSRPSLGNAGDNVPKERIRVSVSQFLGAELATGPDSKLSPAAAATAASLRDRSGRGVFVPLPAFSNSSVAFSSASAIVISGPATLADAKIAVTPTPVTSTATIATVDGPAFIPPLPSRDSTLTQPPLPDEQRGSTPVNTPLSPRLLPVPTIVAAPETAVVVNPLLLSLAPAKKPATAPELVRAPTGTSTAVAASDKKPAVTATVGAASTGSSSTGATSTSPAASTADKKAAGSSSSPPLSAVAATVSATPAPANTTPAATATPAAVPAAAADKKPASSSASPPLLPAAAPVVPATTGVTVPAATAAPTSTPKSMFAPVPTAAATAKPNTAPAATTTTVASPANATSPKAAATTTATTAGAVAATPSAATSPIPPAGATATAKPAAATAPPVTPIKVVAATPTASTTAATTNKPAVPPTTPTGATTPNGKPATTAPATPTPAATPAATKPVAPAVPAVPASKAPPAVTAAPNRQAAPSRPAPSAPLRPNLPPVPPPIAPRAKPGTAPATTTAAPATPTPAQAPASTPASTPAPAATPTATATATTAAVAPTATTVTPVSAVTATPSTPAAAPVAAAPATAAPAATTAPAS